jgi:hypothetical protein
MTKTWFVDGQIIEQEIPEDEFYKRAWVGLSRGEQFSALIACDPTSQRLPPGFKEFADQIEAKLKELNT